MATQTLMNLLSVILFPVLFLAGCNDRPQAPKGPKVPVPTLQAKAEPGELRITVTIPDGHHAYLDAGKDGNFIPLDFQWKGLAQAPKPKQAPKGEFDAEGRVHVLRGKADFRFQHTNADSLKGKTVGVRTQICNDNTGICYRPTVTDVTIQ